MEDEGGEGAGQGLRRAKRVRTVAPAQPELPPYEASQQRPAPFYSHAVCPGEVGYITDPALAESAVGSS